MATIAPALRSVTAGQSVLGGEVLGRVDALMRGAVPPAPEPARLEALTEREREILVLVARGMTNDEIGAELFISPATVKTHLARVMAKLGAHDRAQLVVRAYEGGLVRPGARGEGPLAQPRPTISPTPRGQFCAKAQKLSGVHRTNCGDCAKPQSRALRFPQFRLHSLTRLL